MRDADRKGLPKTRQSSGKKKEKKAWNSSGTAAGL
jgi:hypothetical protein